MDYKIYDVEIANKKQLDNAERHFIKLMKITESDWFFVENGIFPSMRLLANLILSTKSKKKFKIDTSDELEALVSSWRSAGIRIDPKKIIDILTLKIKRTKFKPK